MRVADLDGDALDLAVARAAGLKPYPRSRGEHIWYCGPEYYVKEDYKPSTNWACGGPIIEREGIGLLPDVSGWEAGLIGKTNPCDDLVTANGPTPLIAAMRAFVIAKLGAEITE